MIICQCSAASKKVFEQASDELDTDPAKPTRKVAGKVLLHVRAGKTCMGGGCDSCMPSVRTVIEERRLARGVISSKMEPA